MQQGEDEGEGAMVLLGWRAASSSKLGGSELTRWLRPPFFQHFQNEASVPQRRRRSGAEWWGGGERGAGWGEGDDLRTKGEQSYSVAFRVKESLGLDLPLPRMIFCSSFCCFCRSCSSFMRSSWIFLCSSTIRNWSSASLAWASAILRLFSSRIFSSSSRFDFSSS